jgi:hypothetical protein
MKNTLFIISICKYIYRKYKNHQISIFLLITVLFVLCRYFQPTAPTIFTTQVSWVQAKLIKGKRVVLIWPQITKPSEYEVRYSINGAPINNRTDGIRDTILFFNDGVDSISDTLKNILDSTKYIFAVFSRDSANANKWSVTPALDTLVTPGPLLNVDSLRVSAVTCSTIALAWISPKQNNVDSVKVVWRDDKRFPKSDSDGSFFEKGISEPSTILLKELSEKHWYWISVFTRDTLGNWSEPTESARCSVRTRDTTLPLPINSFAAECLNNSTIRLHWHFPQSGDADSIRLCYATDSLCPESPYEGVLLSSKAARDTMDTLWGALPNKHYCIAAFVCDSSKNWSKGTSVHISTGQDTVLRADAGHDTSSNIKIPIQLNGEKSSVLPKGDISYHWRSLSGGKLTDTTTAKPAFVADTAGKYSILLIVSSGGRQSAASYINITVYDTTSALSLKANAGKDTSVSIKASVRLDGSGSSASRPIKLSYHWTPPNGVTLQNADSVQSIFTADSSGKYVFALTISGGGITSSPSFVAITVNDTTRLTNHDTTDSIPPLNVRNLTALVIGDSSVLLRWDPSISNDAKTTVISYNADGSCSSGPSDPVAFHQLRPKSASSDTIVGLKQKVLYCFTVSVQDSSGNWNFPNDTARTRIMLPDKTKPHNITNLTATLIAPTIVALSWLRSSSPDADSISICVGTAGFPAAHAYGASCLQMPNTIQQDTIAGLSEKTIYYFGGFAKDSAGNWCGPWTSAQVSTRSGDSTLPKNVTNFKATALPDGRVVVQGLKSASTDADSISVRFRTDGQYPLTCSNGQPAIRATNRDLNDTISGLTEKTIAYFGAFVKDSSGNWSGVAPSAQDTARTPDVTRPANITNLGAVLGDNKCFLSWTPSVSADADSLVIRYRTDGSYPLNETDGTLVHLKSASVSSDTMTNVDTFSIYQFAVFVKDTAGWWSIGTASSRVTPDRPPKANAGADMTISLATGTSVQLDGSQSKDPESRPLIYRWIGAENNPAAVNIASVAKPIFNLVVPGKYVFILTVSDGILNSKPDQVAVTFLAPRIIVSSTMPPGAGYVVCRTVQEGVDSARSGDTMFIAPGTYQENVSIRMNNLFIYSSDTTTIIDGKSSGSGIAALGARNLTLKNLKVIHGGRTDPDQIDVGGITCSTAVNVTIDGCVLSTNNGDGIRLWVSTGINIVNSRIIANDWNGIRATSSAFMVRNTLFYYNSTKDDSAKTSNISLEMRSLEETKYNVVALDNLFRSQQGGHHIGIYGPFVLTITGNVFQSDASGHAIGEAIASTGGSKCQINMSTNRFANNTPITSVFCIDAEQMTISDDTLQFSASGPGSKGYDLVNCCQGSTGSEIQSCVIEGYASGAKFTDSPLTVANNAFSSCATGIVIVGSKSFAPKLSANTFTGCTVEVDSSGVH